ncbi:MAG: cupin domain-containing protein [Planctomycetota bacterium]|jgi:predicted cupin superfamily sugar epimerase
MAPTPSSDLTADRLIERVKLEPHPEGGFYRETYRAAEAIAAEDGLIMSHPRHEAVIRALTQPPRS